MGEPAQEEGLFGVVNATSKNILVCGILQKNLRGIAGQIPSRLA